MNKDGKMSNIPFLSLGFVLSKKPTAVAKVSGSEEYPNIRGRVRFYQTSFGVLVAAEILGLPTSLEECEECIFAFHIHEGKICEGDTEDPFSKALSHYNPNNCGHPFHAGDLPPLFGSDGYALSIFLTDRFTVKEVIGRTVIVHAGLDNFTTQPGGNAGKKIACGEIKYYKK